MFKTTIHQGLTLGKLGQLGPGTASSGSDPHRSDDATAGCLETQDGGRTRNLWGVIRTASCGYVFLHSGYWWIYPSYEDMEIIGSNVTMVYLQDIDGHLEYVHGSELYRIWTLWICSWKWMRIFSNHLKSTRVLKLALKWCLSVLSVRWLWDGGASDGEIRWSRGFSNNQLPASCKNHQLDCNIRIRPEKREIILRYLHRDWLIMLKDANQLRSLGSLILEL